MTDPRTTNLAHLLVHYCTAVRPGYPETGSRNKSAVHWDFICDMRSESEIHVDGELFCKDGKFALEGLPQV